MRYVGVDCKAWFTKVLWQNLGETEELWMRGRSTSMSSTPSCIFARRVELFRRHRDPVIIGDVALFDLNLHGARNR
jgi:hypothetical protein